MLQQGLDRPEFDQTHLLSTVPQYCNSHRRRLVLIWDSQCPSACTAEMSFPKLSKSHFPPDRHHLSDTVLGYKEQNVKGLIW